MDLAAIARAEPTDELKPTGAAARHHDLRLLIRHARPLARHDPSARTSWQKRAGGLKAGILEDGAGWASPARGDSGDRRFTVRDMPHASRAHDITPTRSQSRRHAALRERPSGYHISMIGRRSLDNVGH